MVANRGPLHWRTTLADGRASLRLQLQTVHWNQKNIRGYAEPFHDYFVALALNFVTLALNAKFVSLALNAKNMPAGRLS
jgi:hypothetical protein